MSLRFIVPPVLHATSIIVVWASVCDACSMRTHQETSEMWSRDVVLKLDTSVLGNSSIGNNVSPLIRTRRLEATWAGNRSGAESDTSVYSLQQIAVKTLSLAMSTCFTSWQSLVSIANSISSKHAKVTFILGLNIMLHRNKHYYTRHFKIHV
jgi:hypothetical protein